MAKKFYRTHDDKVLGGVCGGIAKYFGLDATIVRLVCVGLALVGGAGIAVYVLLWLFTPDSASGDIGADAVFDFYQAHRDRPSNPR
ncbi:MAG: PspC domain-containing protein [Propionibacteriaceae bacterium]|nr:PspC domain-containing protein [Propionibacteriaceae bacterium]